ncbi:hypothetical protein [Streptomyces sp. NPDC055189]
MAFDEVTSRLSTTFTTTPWKAAGGEYHKGVYRGCYEVDLADDQDERAPHRPLLHGATLYQLAEFHALSSALFAYFHGHHPLFVRAGGLPWQEARRRFLLTSVDLKLVRPVFDHTVPVTLILEDFHDKLDTHQLVFFNGRADVGDGAQQARIGGCLNLRDDLISA